MLHLLWWTLRVGRAVGRGPGCWQGESQLWASLCCSPPLIHLGQCAWVWGKPRSMQMLTLCLKTSNAVCGQRSFLQTVFFTCWWPPLWSRRLIQCAFFFFSCSSFPWCHKCHVRQQCWRPVVFCVACHLSWVGNNTAETQTEGIAQSWAFLFLYSLF